MRRRIHVSVLVHILKRQSPRIFSPYKATMDIESTFENVCRARCLAGCVYERELEASEERGPRQKFSTKK